MASEALALCDRTGTSRPDPMVLSVLGFIALSLDDPEPRTLTWATSPT